MRIRWVLALTAVVAAAGLYAASPRTDAIDIPYDRAAAGTVRPLVN